MTYSLVGCDRYTADLVDIRSPNMPFIAIALLVIQGAVLLVWIFFAFSWLFALRADAVAESGSPLPGLGATLRAFRGGFTDQRYAKHWLRLGVTTVLLLGLAVLSPIVMQTSAG
jgi:hypothetical protein